MKCTVTKWGNSYAIRIPKTLVDEYNLKGETLTLERKDDAILLKKPSKEDQLTKLLLRIKPQQETDWGAARGKEVW